MNKGSPQVNRFELLFNTLGRRLRPLKRVVCWLIFTLLLIELLSFAVITIHHAVRNEELKRGGRDDPRKHSEVYADKDWSEAYFQEFAESYRTGYRSYTEYRRLPFAGHYINIDADGLRRTTPDCGSDRVNAFRIFFLGGSAVWGTGARDENTIPSQLARKLCDLGVPATVTNFGESGYTNTQELIQLQLELRRSRVPDIVIFYDGVNDVYSSYQNRISGLPQNVANRKIAYQVVRKSAAARQVVKIFLLSNTGRIAKKILAPIFRPRSEEPPAPAGQNEDLDMETLRTIVANMRIVRALEREYGFGSFLYWQPTVYNKDVHSPDEREKIKKDPAFGQMYVRVTELVKQEKSIIDLSETFDAYSRTFFIDEFHISEEGNGIVTEAILEEVLSYLDAIEDQPRGEG